MAHPVHTIFVAAYLVALIVVGALKAGKVKSQEDFSLAGRGLSTFVLVGTLLATWIGTGSIFGNAEKTYEIGVGAFIIPLAGTIGIAVLFFLAARIRGTEQFTIQDILEHRYGLGCRILGLLALFFAYVIIVSYQYRAGAAVIDKLIPDFKGTHWSTISVAVFVIGYTALAGMFSVAYTDVANGVLMVLGIVIAIPILLSETGGLTAAVAALPEKQAQMTSSYTGVNLINWLLPAFLLILGDANVYQRFFSAKTPKVARRSAAWLILGIAALETAIILIALLGRALVAQGKLAAPDKHAHIVVSLAFDTLHPLLGALLMGTIIAIVVSTADSFLLAPSTSFVRDVYKRFIVRDADETHVVLIGRVVVVVYGLIALVLAFQSQRFFDVALFAYTIYGASITPALLAAFFWPRATKTGALCGMATGMSVALLWKWQQGKGGLIEAVFGETFRAVDAVLPALFLSVVVLVVVSLAGKPDAPKEMTL